MAAVLDVGQNKRGHHEISNLQELTLKFPKIPTVFSLEISLPVNVAELFQHFLILFLDNASYLTFFSPLTWLS
ncbi:MAG: hypothetical protein ACLQHK_07285 [Gallionellaceae bacterium]